jgi:uncharacterized protein (TIGR03067 family)
MVLSIGSCLALLVAGTTLVPGFAGPAAQKQMGLPAELQGVWTIVSGEADGTKLKFARGADVEAGECVFNEIIVQADRWIINDNWGRASVYRAKVVATRPVKQIRVWGDRAETRKGGASCFIYRLNGDELTVCSAMGDQPPSEFSAAKGSGHMVLVLKRSN